MKLRSLLREKGLTQADLAEKVGVSPTTVSHWVTWLQDRQRGRPVGPEHLADVVRVSGIPAKTWRPDLAAAFEATP